MGRKKKLIKDNVSFEITIDRLCHEIIENHNDFSQSAILGLQPGGKYLAERISNKLGKILKCKSIPKGNLDITFFRDDFRRKEKPLLAEETSLSFQLEDRKVILVDDVFYTGRTARAALEAMLSFGRPRQVELLVFINRRYNRDVPIQPTYIGQTVDSIASQRVTVQWAEVHGSDKVWLITREADG